MHKSVELIGRLRFADVALARQPSRQVALVHTILMVGTEANEKRKTSPAAEAHP
jgi:hypothetical protein